jgi:glycosyltransferase involved in cell wall biosynthesis
LSKKILIFIEWYKPGYKAGGPIRSISNLVDHLNEKAEIYIITGDIDYQDTKPYFNIETNKWQITDNANVIYLSKSKINYATIKTLIKEVSPNIIYCNSLYSPKFTIIPTLIAKKLNIKTILAVRGMLSLGSLSVKNHKKQVFITLVKTIRLFNKTLFHATNADEKNDIINTFGKKVNIIIAQNLPEKKIIPFIQKNKQVGQLKLISVGRIAPEKNTLYALKVLTKVKTNVVFDIFGPIYNDEYWEKCKKVINQLPNNTVVNYRNALPHKDLNITLQKYHALFLPSTGENFGHIIIEAMMNSCIPIISEKTPWKNLEKQQVGYDVSLNDEKSFSEIIDTMANMNHVEFNFMSKKTHEFALNILKNEDLIQDYYKLFQL